MPFGTTAGAQGAGASGSAAGAEQVAETAKKGRKLDRVRNSTRPCASQAQRRSQLRAAAHAGAAER